MTCTVHQARNEFSAPRSDLSDAKLFLCVCDVLQLALADQPQLAGPTGGAQMAQASKAPLTIMTQYDTPHSQS